METPQVGQTVSALYCFSLPMRDGNREMLRAGKLVQDSFSLPMRDGNNQTMIDILESAILVLAYL